MDGSYSSKSFEVLQMKSSFEPLEISSSPPTSPSYPTSSSLTPSIQTSIQSSKIEHTDQGNGTSSIPLAVSNMLNSIVGAGVIGIPFALRHTGVLSGVLMLSYVAYLTNQTVQLIVKLGQKLKVLNYEDLAKKVFGNKGYNFMSVMMLLLAFGSMIAYLIILGDIIPSILELPKSSTSRTLSIILTSLLCILPLSLLKDMSSLAFTSTLSVLADFILIIIIISCVPLASSLASGGGLWKVLTSSIIKPSTFFSGLGAMSFAFVCHHSSFFVYGSLKNNTKKRWGIVTKSSVSLAYSMCLALGVMGYLGFLEDTKGDILNNFEILDDPKFDAPLKIGRGMLALTMIFTYPMESFVARHSIACLYYGEVGANSITDNARNFITVCLYILALMCALLFTDLGVVLELTGAVSASFLAYILPSVMYLCVYEDEFRGIMIMMGDQESWWTIWYWIAKIIQKFSILGENRRGKVGGATVVRSTSDASAPDTGREDVLTAAEVGDGDKPVEIQFSHSTTILKKISAYGQFNFSISVLIFGVVAFFIGTINVLVGVVLG